MGSTVVSNKRTGSTWSARPVGTLRMACCNAYAINHRNTRRCFDLWSSFTRVFFNVSSATAISCNGATIIAALIADRSVKMSSALAPGARHLGKFMVNHIVITVMPAHPGSCCAVVPGRTEPEPEPGPRSRRSGSGGGQPLKDHSQTCHQSCVLATLAKVLQTCVWGMRGEMLLDDARWYQMDLALGNSWTVLRYFPTSRNSEIPLIVYAVQTSGQDNTDITRSVNDNITQKENA